MVFIFSSFFKRNEPTVPYKMLSSVGNFYPQRDSCKFNGFDQEYEQLHSNYRPTLSGTKANANTTYEHWIPPNTDVHKNGPFIIRSQFDQFATLHNPIHNDENDGLVFGCPEQYYDTRQYSWV